MLYLANGDSSKEQKRQGLTSVGIKDAAHQASGRVEELSKAQVPYQWELNQGSVEKGSKAVQHHSGLSRADTLCTPSLSQHSTSDSSDNATERERAREREDEREV